MKLVRSQYVTLTCPKYQSTWSFSLPGSYLTLQKGEVVKICVRQIVYRNDFSTVQNTSYINFGITGGPYYTVYGPKKGSPNIRDLINDINGRQITPAGYNDFLPISISFDRITSHVTFNCPIAAAFGTQTFQIIMDYAFANVLGLTAATYPDGSSISGFIISYDSKGKPSTVTIPFTSSQPTVIGSNEVDLAGPECLFLRMSGIQSTNVEIDSNNLASVRDLLTVFPNDCAPYGTGSFQDPQAVYSQYINPESLSSFSLSLSDSNDNPCVSSNEVTITFSLDIYQDDSKDMLESIKELLDLKKTQLLGLNLSRNQ